MGKMEVGVLMGRRENHRRDGEDRAEEQGRRAEQYHDGGAFRTDSRGEKLFRASDEDESEGALHVGKAVARNTFESTESGGCRDGMHGTAGRNTRDHVRQQDILKNMEIITYLFSN